MMRPLRDQEEQGKRGERLVTSIGNIVPRCHVRYESHDNYEAGTEADRHEQ